MNLKKNKASSVLLSKEETTFTESDTDVKDISPFVSVDCLNASWTMQPSELDLHDISFTVNKVSILWSVSSSKSYTYLV